MNFSQNLGDSSFSAPPRPSGIASDRLQKAIERNRAKQAKRLTKKPEVVTRATPRVVATPRQTVAKPNEFEFASQLRKTGVKVPTKANYQVKSRASTMTRASSTSRLSNASPVKRKTTTKRVKSHSKTAQYVTRGLWVFVACLVLRLVFSDGGVVDYYSQLERLEGTENRLAGIHHENDGLKKEINQIKNSRSYQRKLIRDHLGYIAKNEYIVLFSSSR